MNISVSSGIILVQGLTANDNGRHIGHIVNRDVS